MAAVTNVQQRQDYRQERIDVLCRVPGEPAELVGRRVAILERSIAVSVFVRDHRKQQDGRNQNECLELVQIPSRDCLVLMRVQVTLKRRFFRVRFERTSTERIKGARPHER